MTSTVTEQTEQADATFVPAQPEQTSSRPSARGVQDAWLVLASIVALGGISGIAYYLGFTRPYLLSEYYEKPLLDLAKINGHTAPSANAWALTWIVLFACYYLAFRICPSARHISRGFRWTALFIICGWATIFCINLVFMYPVGAADIFDQMLHARVQAVHGLNPFIVPPNTIEGDPFLPYIAWKSEPSHYGPLWQMFAAGTSLVAGDSLWNNLILFKLLVILAYGVSVALTYGILRTVKPEWALRGTLFFAWNPLVLFEIAGNGHNDAFIVVFSLAAIYLFVMGWRRAVIPTLIAGALAKFLPILLVPVAVAVIWRDRCSRFKVQGSRFKPPATSHRPLTTFDAFSTLATSITLAAGLVVLLYAPFWEGPKSIGATRAEGMFTASIPKVTLDLLEIDLALPGPEAQAIVRYAALALMALVTVGFGLWIFLKGNARTPGERQVLVDRTLRAFYEVIFIYLAFATLWFQPWYLMWLVALTAPLASYTHANRTILFCIGGVANYFVWDYIWLWNRTDIRDIQITSALAVYTLPLLYTFYLWLKPLWAKRDQDIVAGGRGPNLENSDRDKGAETQPTLVEAQYPLSGT